MVQKQIVAIKLPKEEAAALKTEAALKKITVTELIAGSLQNRQTQDHLKQKIEDLETSLQDLQQKHQAMTGKKLEPSARISFTVTVKQRKMLNMEAAKQNIPRSELLQNALFPNPAQKALT